VLARRQEELDAMLTLDGVADRIWHVEREAEASGPIDWSREAQR